MKSLNIERTLNAPLDVVWKVVSDVDGYARYAPNIDASQVVSGEGVGMVRECSSKEGRWQEICTHWENLNYYVFQIQTQASDYPFPFKALQGKWSVEAVNEKHTVIHMKFDFDFKNKVVGLLLYPLMRKKFLKICEELLDNWQRAIQ